jgi:hypothetical protein
MGRDWWALCAGGELKHAGGSPVRYGTHLVTGAWSAGLLIGKTLGDTGKSLKTLAKTDDILRKTD